MCADWLDENGDPDAGAFVRAQVAAARHEGGPNYRLGMEGAATARRLYRANKRRWLAPLRRLRPFGLNPVFARGFPSRLTLGVPGDAPAEIWEPLAAWPTLESLTAWGRDFPLEVPVRLGLVNLRQLVVGPRTEPPTWADLQPLLELPRLRLPELGGAERAFAEQWYGARRERFAALEPAERDRLAGEPYSYAGSRKRRPSLVRVGGIGTGPCAISMPARLHIAGNWGGPAEAAYALTRLAHFRSVPCPVRVDLRYGLTADLSALVGVQELTLFLPRGDWPLDALPELPVVRRLTLRFIRGKASDWRAMSLRLERMPQLASLSAYGDHWFNAREVEHFCQLPKLRTLSLVAMTTDAIAEIGSTQLRELAWRARGTLGDQSLWRDRLPALDAWPVGTRTRWVGDRWAGADVSLLVPRVLGTPTPDAGGWPTWREWGDAGDAPHGVSPAVARVLPTDPADAPGGRWGHGDLMCFAASVETPSGPRWLEVTWGRRRRVDWMTLARKMADSLRAGA